MEERLQKILARAGVASRRKSEELIQQGRVRIDGQVVSDMGVRVDANRHRISVDGKELAGAEEKVYYLLNKPKGYVTTLHDPQKRPIVTDLLKNVPQRVFPVGRLDLDTEGALILTNDGEFADRILHPRNEVRKTYLAEVSGHPSPDKINELAAGIMLEGRRTSPARITLVRKGKITSTYRVVIHEGRKRQVRKMFEAIGAPVVNLKRLAYGNLPLGNLKTGTYRVLYAHDLALIFSQKKPLYNR